MSIPSQFCVREGQTTFVSQSPCFSPTVDVTKDDGVLQYAEIVNQLL